MADALPERIVRASQNHKPWVVGLAGLVVVVLLGVCAFGSYLIVSDGTDEQQAAGEPTPTEPARRDISDRQADPKALTAKDVFPSADVTIDPAIPPYKLLGQPQVAKDCRFAAQGEIGKLLVASGCNQVVRGTLRSTESNYLVTVGIFNLKDEASATKAHDDIKKLVADKKGRFTGYISGDKATTIMGNAPTHLAWAPEGHFLMYCVIAKPDGKEFPAGDPVPKVIIHDMVELYLREVILGKWSLAPAGASAPPSPKATQPAASG